MGSLKRAARNLASSLVISIGGLVSAATNGPTNIFPFNGLILGIAFKASTMSALVPFPPFSKMSLTISSFFGVFSSIHSSKAVYLTVPLFSLAPSMNWKQSLRSAGFKSLGSLSNVFTNAFKKSSYLASFILKLTNNSFGCFLLPTTSFFSSKSSASGGRKYPRALKNFLASTVSGPLS